MSYQQKHVVYRNGTFGPYHDYSIRVYPYAWEGNDCNECCMFIPDARVNPEGNLCFVYIYDTIKADIFNPDNKRPWAVMNACVRVVGYHDDATLANWHANDLNNDMSVITLKDTQCASVGEIPLCHDEHCLA